MYALSSDKLSGRCMCACFFASGLLVLIGGNMLREALSKDEEKETNKMDVKTMFMLAWLPVSTPSPAEFSEQNTRPKPKPQAALCLHRRKDPA